MFRLKDYICVQSLEQGYELLTRDKDNVILGGLLWMRMGRKNYHTGIDLSCLGLNQILETDDTIEIGCMTTLRQMETSPLLNQWFGPLFSDAFKPIVGVQFRNLATLGGSVYSQFGFSDVITAFMALETQVQLYQKGLVLLDNFLSMPRSKDILEKIVIRKRAIKTSYQSRRMSATDFPVLSVATSFCDEKWKISIGARPNKASLAVTSAGLLSPEPDADLIGVACDSVVKEISFGSNLRGSRAYREILAKVLVKRGIQEICR